MNATSSEGVTALHRAASGNKVESIGALIDMGALVDARDETGVTPLTKAASNAGDSCAAMRALLKRGANVNAQDTKMQSPLHWAIFSPLDARLDDLTRKIEVLLELDADEMAIDRGGFTARDMIEEMDIASREDEWDTFSG